MKKCFPLAIVFVLFSFASKAQSKLSINVGPEVDLPMGTFGDAYKLGFGGTAKLLYDVTQMGQVTFTSGYQYFKGKSDVNGFDYSKQKVGIIPLLLGFREKFSGLYVEPNLGMAVYQTKVPGFSESETRFTWALGAGYLVNSNIDLGLRFQSHEGASMFAFRVAYNSK